jgi:hypothetical protein
MRLFFVLLLLSSVSAFADSSYAPLAYPTSNVPGLYRRAALPTPVPTPMDSLSVTHIEMTQDNMSIAVDVGAAMPLGTMAKNNSTGLNAGLDVIFGVSPLVDLAFSMSYASMPYSLTTAAQPQTATGLGVKALLKVYDDRKLFVDIDGGIGYYFVNSATDQSIGTDSKTQLPIYGTVYQSEGGLGFNLGLKADYRMTPNLSAFGQVDLVQISLNGGTGATPLFLTPSLGISYMF